jgi:hypothetical protein
MIRTARVTMLVLVVSVVSACSLFGRGGQDRFVREDAPRTSPSGQFTASLKPGPEQSGVKTWAVVISDKDGGEVFRDPRNYSDRHGVGVTWLSSADQLWILSSDIGTSYVERQGGAWVKTEITPETRDRIPDEIQKLK